MCIYRLPESIRCPVWMRKSLVDIECSLPFCELVKAPATSFFVSARSGSSAETVLLHKNAAALKLSVLKLSAWRNLIKRISEGFLLFALLCTRNDLDILVFFLRAQFCHLTFRLTSCFFLTSSCFLGSSFPFCIFVWNMNDIQNGFYFPHFSRSNRFAEQKILLNKL